MASQATALKKLGMGKGPNHVPKAPANPDDRTLIRIRLPPENTCMRSHARRSPGFGWLYDGCVTYSGLNKYIANYPFLTLKLYRWEDEQGSLISTIFWEKCAARTKDNLAKERRKTLINAGIDHPDENAIEYMHEYSPWWCSADIWEEMCNQWRDEKWLKKGKTASSNRSAGGEKAKGTYKGGSISQLQHIATRESQSQGPINWVDVYVKTRDGLSEAATIAEKYHRLYDEHYPEGTERPYFDQDIWEMASEVKKNYVKGQGQRRRPPISGSSFSTQSSQSSSQPVIHTPASYSYFC
ncbi:uncharacterized protein LOC141695819 [Apium graveolens]|uniref:uncharacterized protein LOC141695819 n=1 Tax=Apium graveolens TaxID=4045 RepID=UPI003D7A02EB